MNKDFKTAKKQALMLVYFCFAAVFLCSQTSRVLPSGVSYDEIGSVLDSYIADNEKTTAAVSIKLFSGDEQLYFRNAGYADKENGIKNSADTVFEWGSSTKLLVWTSVMQLYERGLIDLDADIRTYIGNDFLTKLQYDSPITMYNLMHHNAGWQDVLTGLFVESESDILPLEQMLKKTEPLQIYEPGTIVGYSNWGVALAGYIVECISGKPFYEYVNDNIFKPLGMTSTSVHPSLSDNPQVKNQRNRIRGYTAQGDRMSKDLFYIPLYPAGMGTGTLDDYAAFAQALIPPPGESGPLFQKAETLELMLSPSLYYTSTDIERNCHGFWVLHFADTVAGHGGNTAAMSSYLLVHREKRLAVVVMTNQAQEIVYNSYMMKHIFGSKAYTVDSSIDITPFEGIYNSSRTIEKGHAKLYSLLAVLFAKKVDSTTLSGSALGQAYLLKPVSEHYFMIDGPDIGYGIASFKDKDGTQIFSVPFQDFIKTSSLSFYARISLFIFLFLGALYCAGRLLAQLIAAVIRRVKKQRLSQAVHVISLTNTAFFSGYLLSFVCILLVFVSLISFQSFVVIKIFTSAVLLFTAVYLLALFLCGLQAAGTSVKKSTKVLFIVHACSGVLLLVFTLMYDLFPFM